MKLLMTGLCVSGALMLAACADTSGPGGYAYGYGGGPVGYDGYYDDAYGPFYDGYWAGDGYFYYRSGEHGRYRRDDDHHFHHDAGAGMHPVQGHPHSPGSGGDHHPDRPH